MRRLGETETTDGDHPLTTDRLLAALRAGSVGTWHWDLLTGNVQWDTALEAVFDLEPGTFGGTLDDWLARVHPDDIDGVQGLLRQTTATPDPDGRYRVQHRFFGKDGTVRWLEGRGDVTTDQDGRVVALFGIGYDVTDRVVSGERTSELLRAEQALRARLALLADASSVLTRSLNADAALRQLAKIVVPRLADSCAIHLASRGTLRLVASAGEGPPEALSSALLSGEHGPAAVVRSGEPSIIHRADQRVLEEVAEGDADAETLAAARVTSAIVVPLRARGRTLGTLTLLSCDPDRIYDDDDLALAVDVGQRAGIAVDNAQLFAEQRRVATILQDSLLPPTLPEIPGARVSGAYEPAAMAFDVGGDFYDVFANPDGATWTVLIGDVRGKGPDAAALSSLCRHTVRAAVTRETDPTRVLGVLNDVLVHDDPLESFCTAVCVRLEPTPSGLAARVAAGGHPTALVVRADGTIESVSSTGMLIGLFPDLDIGDSTVDLASRDSLFLYTDGVLDARRGNEVFGQERLYRVLAEHAGNCAEQLAQHVLAAVQEFRDDDHRDDIAMLCISAAGDNSAHLSNADL